MKTYRYEIHETLRVRRGLVTARDSDQAFKVALMHEGIQEATVVKANFRPACTECYSLLIDGRCDDCADPFAAIIQGTMSS